MIRLTRLNNQPLVVNSDLIKSVESLPDTVLTLVTGEKIVVLESSDEVLERVIEFRRKIIAGLDLPPWHAPQTASPTRDIRGEAKPSAKRT
jgi:uncharacterized protein YlzI (FlbEa/FlbD family)